MSQMTNFAQMSKTAEKKSLLTVNRLMSSRFDLDRSANRIVILFHKEFY